ncbi:hypothetical protein [Amycolatopsis coloradensis]|uniref:hypothetical protein n=1 Tax=Amycolatopsis coloradensis TaxID=76021 RepID=UPI001FC9C8DB|nr:hypothetical protein [Amycolatopsis coloradensis]
MRVIEYLGEEVRLGRIREDADLEASASLLLGACFPDAFLASFEAANRPKRNWTDGRSGSRRRWWSRWCGHGLRDVRRPCRESHFRDV